MKEDVIRAHAELPALCEQIHLPLQSGSSAVLKRMRRTYDRQRYMDRVALIREHVPDCAITTDIIVGFPGETEADFARDPGSGRGGRLRRRLHLRLLAAARNRGGDDGRAAAAPGQGRAHGAAGRGGPAAGRRSGPSASSAARWRCWSKAPAAPTRPGCAGAPGTTRRSTSRASPSPGELVDGRDRQRHLADAERGLGEAALAAPLSVLAIFGPDRGRQDRRGDRAGRAAAGARGGPGGDLLRRAAGLRGARGPHRAPRAPRSRRGWSTG